MDEIPLKRPSFALGWVVVLALGFSVLGFATPAWGQASGAASHGEGELSINATGDLVIDLCKWEPMSCERCLIEPWYCYGGSECMIEPWLCVEERKFALSITKAGTGTGIIRCKVGAGSVGSCAAQYPTGTSLMLIAEAAGDSEFTGFSSGTGSTSSCSASPCSFTVTANSALTATFNLKPITESKTSKVIQVSKTGTGSGTVKSIPAGIDCGATCTAEFVEGEKVTLWAGAAAGSVVSSWRGCDVAIGRECRITVDGAEAVSARFTEVKTLSAQKEGEGAGLVTTSPGGIACPMACFSTSALFPTGRSVAVTAVPAKGSVFTGWGGACSGTGACAVTLSESKLVTAEFTPLPKRSLTLNKEGSGAGIVKSPPSTFNCGALCASQTSSFNEGTVVTLIQTPAKGSVFGGWTGACSGTGACVVTLSEAETVGAAFALIEGKPPGPTRLLTVGKAEGTGTGTVGSNPGGITCYSGCTHQSARFKEGAVVALEATPGRGSTFAEWGGACSGAGACEVTMSEARSVTAEFTATPTKTLTVNKAGEGAGTVVGRPSGISCRQNCTTATAFFPQTTAVALTPIHGRFASGYVQWEGCDSFEGVECIVATPGDRTVTAKFD